MKHYAVQDIKKKDSEVVQTSCIIQEEGKRKRNPERPTVENVV